MNRAVALAVIFLAGCLHPSAEPGPNMPPPPSLACVSAACPADLTDPDAIRSLAEYNLTQITYDKAEQYSVTMDGDLVAWVVDEPTEFRPGFTAADVITFDISTREMLPADNRTGKHSIRPIVDQGRVFYEVSSATEAGSPISVWRADSRTRQELPSPFISKGQGTIKAVNGSWMAFIGTLAETWERPSDTGMFFWNMDTDQLINVYDARDGNKLPDNSFETFTDMVIVDNIGYYGITRATPYVNRQQTYNATIYEINLETGARREWFFNDGINGMAANRDYVVFEVGLDIWGLNVTTGQFFQINDDGATYCGFPVMKKDWLVYYCGHTPPPYPTPGAWGRNFATGQRFVLAAPGLIIGDVATDGKNLVVEAYMNDPSTYKHPTKDLYWMPLPGPPNS